MKPVLLCVCVVTYNHEQFIAQTLDGFVMQKTDFAFQVLIGDDASTDNTAQIIKQYADKYPDLIKPIFHKKNIGAFNNSMSVYSAAKTKYVAICDGDDYWTDPLKLQKQVDFLEKNDDYAICFHATRIHWEDGAQDDVIFPPPHHRFYRTSLSLKHLLHHNFIQTASTVYRWRFRCEEPTAVIPQNIAPGDWFSLLLHAQKGKVKFLPDVMAVYRRHTGGVWTPSQGKDEWILENALLQLRFYDEMEKMFHNDKSDEKSLLAKQLIESATRLNHPEAIQALKSEFFDVYTSVTRYDKFAFLKHILYYSMTKVTFGYLNQKFKLKKKLYKQEKKERNV